jgi:hypothetical protein
MVKALRAEMYLGESSWRVSIARHAAKIEMRPVVSSREFHSSRIIFPPDSVTRSLKSHSLMAASIAAVRVLNCIGGHGTDP